MLKVVEVAAMLIAGAMNIGTVYLIATLGEIIAERAGVVNLGVEGLMELGATTAIIVALITENPFIGLVAAFTVASILTVAHAYTSVTLGVNQFGSGLAIYIFGLGLGVTIRGYFRDVMMTPKMLMKIPKVKIQPMSIPGLSELPIVKPLLTLNPIVYLVIIASIATWLILYNTRIGLELRSVGENPEAADAAGVNVFKVRYIATVLGGGLAGVAGGYLILAHTVQIMGAPIVMGRGWIAIALVIFSFWSPLRAILGAYLFGGLEVAYYWLQGVRGVSSFLPILKATPHIAAIIALTIMSIEALRKRIGPPEALGRPYKRE